MKYLHSLGGYEHHKPFSSPTLELLLKWSKEWLGTYNTSDYKVILTGGTAEKLFGKGLNETLDIDIVLMNEIKDPQELFNMLEGAIKIGYKHNLLVDIFHATELFQVDKFKPYIQTKCYSTLTTLNSRGRKIVTDLGSHQIIKRYDCGLVSFNRDVPRKTYKKMMDRINEGIYERLQLDLKETVGWK
ncbi:MAG: hypothetical protein ACKVJK_17155 [Methylophagaceae bacterium]|jgi:hypothetical protein|tara:strand:- start:90 stop:650 length:561 start_codon:yes stop_codon:yes gene_type:complete